MASSRFIFKEQCIKNALINVVEFYAGEFPSGEYSTGEFTTGEFDEGEFSAGDLTRWNFPRGSSLSTTSKNILRKQLNLSWDWIKSFLIPLSKKGDRHNT